MLGVFAMLEGFPVFSSSWISLGSFVIGLGLLFVVLLGLGLLVIGGRWASCVRRDRVLCGTCSTGEFLGGGSRLLGADGPP